MTAEMLNFIDFLTCSTRLEIVHKTMQNKFSSYKTVIHQISNRTSCPDLDFSKTKEEANAKI